MLYKFRSFNTFGLQILTNHEIYFASPDNLNDPLDCGFNTLVIKEHFMKLSKIHEESTPKEIGNVFPKAWNNFLKDISMVIEKLSKTVGICSFSLSNNDPLMWSHYADGHRGFCIGFSRSYFDQLVKSSQEKPRLFGGKNVNYNASPNYHNILFNHLQKYDFTQSSENLFDELIISISTAKSDKWKYEEEYRIIRSSEGLVKIQPEGIREIIIGQKPSPSDKAMLLSILENPTLKHIKQKFAEISPNSYVMNI